jgi:hypothetical protein
VSEKVTQKLVILAAAMTLVFLGIVAYLIWKYAHL